MSWNEGVFGGESGGHTLLHTWILVLLGSLRLLVKWEQGHQASGQRNQDILPSRIYEASHSDSGGSIMSSVGGKRIKLGKMAGRLRV